MPPHRVIDLRQLLDEKNGQPTEQVRELATWLGALVECITASGSQERWEPVAVACRQCAPSAYHPIAVRRVGPGIEWLCTTCRASGTVTGWTRSVFDLSDRDDQGADEPNTAVFARLDELACLRARVEDAALRAVLAMTMVQDKHVVMIVTRRELEALLERLQAATGESSGRERYALERLLGRCDAALAVLEREQAAPPTTLH